MKTVQFQGQTYEAPEWAKYITQDANSRYVWAWKNKPYEHCGEWYTAEGLRERLRQQSPDTPATCEELP